MAVFYVLDPDSDGNDLRVRLLPDVVNWPGFAAGLTFSAFVPPDTDSRGFSCGDSCKCDCQDLGREFLTEFLARLSEAFCFGAWRQDTKQRAATREWVWAT